MTTPALRISFTSKSFLVVTTLNFTSLVIARFQINLAQKSLYIKIQSVDNLVEVTSEAITDSFNPS